MDREERKKFRDELRNWLDANDDRHCAEPYSDLDAARWSIYDSINALRTLIEGLRDFKAGNAKLLYNDFSFLSAEQTQSLLRNEEAFENFKASAEGMMQLIDNLLNKA